MTSARLRPDAGQLGRADCAWPSVGTTAAWIAAVGMLDISPAKAGAAPPPSMAASAAAVRILDSFITSPLLFSLVHACRSTLDRLGLMIEGMHYQGSCERLILCGAIVARNP